MKKKLVYISTFRLLAFSVFVLAVWLVCIDRDGGPHGFGKIFEGLLFALAIIIFLLDALIIELFKKSRTNSYLIELIFMILLFGWIYLKAS